MKFKLYYEKNINQMVIDILNKKNSTLYRLCFKNVTCGVLTESKYLEEKDAHPKVWMEGEASKIEIIDIDTLIIS